MSSTATEEKLKRPTKFDAPGLNFKAKLIGLEDVTEPRGDKMCQVAMAKIKAAVLAIGEHKQRITVNISLEGIKILDEKTENVLHHHPVHRISFISRDTNDSRAFGYVYNREDGLHQFIGIKTEKAAEPLVASLKELFLTVVEMKKEKEREQAHNETNIKVSAAEIKDENKEKLKEEIQEEKPLPASTDLLGLDSGLEQGLQQMNAFGSGSTSIWLDNSMFQSAPGTSVATLGQSGSLPMTQPGMSPFLPHGSQQMAGIAVASTMYHQQQTYHQSVPGMQNNASFGMDPTVFPGQSPQGAVRGMQPAWPHTQPPPAYLKGPGAEVRPANPSWMSFDSSTQLSNIFGDLSPPPPASLTHTSAGSSGAFNSVPIQPNSGAGASNDPFAPSTKFPDPFADLAVLQTQGQSQPGKKVSKEDFIKEPPKPTLLDLTQQQQQRQTAAEPPPPAAQGPLQDPFSAVRQPKTRSPYNPFAEEQTPSTNPFAPSHSASPSTVDKSRVALQESDSDGGVGQGQGDPSSGPVSRPRPKGNAGTRPGLLRPLPSKNNADPFGISSA